MIPSILRHSMGGLVSFLNFHGPEENPFSRTTNFKKNFLYKILNILNLLQMSSLSNKRILSLYWSYNNVAESSLLPNVLSSF